MRTTVRTNGAARAERARSFCRVATFEDERSEINPLSTTKRATGKSGRSVHFKEGGGFFRRSLLSARQTETKNPSDFSDEFLLGAPATSILEHFSERLGCDLGNEAVYSKALIIFFLLLLYVPIVKLQLKCRYFLC